jgi:hypothetical protein
MFMSQKSFQVSSRRVLMHVHVATQKRTLFIGDHYELIETGDFQEQFAATAAALFVCLQSFHPLNVF